MTAQEIRGGLQVDPFVVRVWGNPSHWIVDWLTLDDVGVAQGSFREVDDTIEWTALVVLEEWRGHGIYTKVLEWLLSLDVKVTIAQTSIPDTWVGFKSTDGDAMKLDKRSAKARVKRGLKAAAKAG